MRVVIGTDGSRYALAAADFVSRWLPCSELEVDLFAVSPKRQPDRGGHSPPKSPEEQWRKQARRWLERTAKSLESEGARVELRREVGAIAADEFLEQIHYGRYDLAVIGAKGRGEEPYFRTLSVAEAALVDAPVDVLMVRAPDPERQQRKVGSEMEPFRLLAPTDGKSHSELAARRFLELQRIPAMEVKVVSVPELPDEVEERSRSEKREAYAEADEETRARLDRALAWFREADVAADADTLEGSPAEAVVQKARSWGAHLVLLGSQGFEDGKRARESVAVEIAASAPCSVMIVRGDSARLALRE